MSIAENIEELEQEYRDWKNIAQSYDSNDRAADELRRGKEGRCGLCPKYLAIKDIGGVSVQSCRACPVVRFTRRTCAHWWEKKGLDENTPGKEFAETTAEFIQGIITEAKKWAT